jgi:DNA-binding transcriptional ArsR family regulator
MLRIHFTADDLARTRVAPAATAMAFLIPFDSRPYGGTDGELDDQPDERLDGRVLCQVAADLAYRADVMLTGGVERLLESLHPTDIRWKTPVLEVSTRSGMELDVHLGGRGLVLAPSVFGLAGPVVGFGRDQVLAYPIRTDLAATGGAVPPGPRLADLLGRTRAALLEATACLPGRTTGELASLVGVSAASVSQHAAVLRKAGLITTVRDGGRVLHTLAPTGVALLEGRPLPPETQDPYG